MEILEVLEEVVVVMLVLVVTTAAETGRGFCAATLVVQITRLPKAEIGTKRIFKVELLVASDEPKDSTTMGQEDIWIDGLLDATPYPHRIR